MVQHNMAKETSTEMKMVGLTKDFFGVGRNVNLSLKWINMDCWNVIEWSRLALNQMLLNGRPGIVKYPQIQIAKHVQCFVSMEPRIKY